LFEDEYEDDTLAVEEKGSQGSAIGIDFSFQIYPNPFNLETAIRYQLPVLDEPMKSGYHATVWNGRNNRGEKVGSGLYFICLKTGSFTTMKKVIVLK